jgi:RNA polymerase sigma factor (sigma-70 family)
VVRPPAEAEGERVKHGGRGLGHIPRSIELKKEHENIAAPPDDSLEKLEARRELVKLLDTLTLREATVIKLRFGIGSDALTIGEIGRKFKVTRERVRQIERRALFRLSEGERGRKVLQIL